MRTVSFLALIFLVLLGISAHAALPAGAIEEMHKAANAELVVDVKGWAKRARLGSDMEASYLEGAIIKSTLHDIGMPKGDPGPYPVGAHIFVSVYCYPSEGPLMPGGPHTHCSDIKPGQKWVFWVDMKDSNTRRDEKGIVTVQVDNERDYAMQP